MTKYFRKIGYIKWGYFLVPAHSSSSLADTVCKLQSCQFWHGYTKFAGIFLQSARLPTKLHVSATQSTVWFLSFQAVIVAVMTTLDYTWRNAICIDSCNYQVAAASKQPHPTTRSLTPCWQLRSDIRSVRSAVRASYAHTPASTAQIGTISKFLGVRSSHCRVQVGLKCDVIGRAVSIVTCEDAKRHQEQLGQGSMPSGALSACCRRRAVLNPALEAVRAFGSFASNTSSCNHCEFRSPTQSEECKMGFHRCRTIRFMW